MPAIDEVSEEVKLFLLSDRQWPRELRIGHAKRRYALAVDDNERDFWSTVIEANT